MLHCSVKVRRDSFPPGPMNASTDNLPDAIDLAEIIEFKWLLVGEGVHVHVERLQRDPVYARECLARGDAAPRELVRKASARLRQRLGLT